MKTNEKAAVAAVSGKGRYMFKVNIPRLITCFIIGLVSTILFCLSITCFDLVFLLFSLATMILATIAVLQYDRIDIWGFNTISYVWGLILSLSVEIRLDFIHVLFDFTHPDSKMSYAETFGIIVLGPIFFCAYLFCIVGSFITTLVRKCVSK